MTALAEDQARISLAREALVRVLGSEAFRRSPQLASFLTFVVEKTLVGRETEIKGYTIAVDALGRPADFDPQADPIVRVEAQRLRRALDRYYASNDGVVDPVRIDIPNGSYIPDFISRDVISAISAVNHAGDQSASDKLARTIQPNEKNQAKNQKIPKNDAPQHGAADLRVSGKGLGLIGIVFLCLAALAVSALAWRLVQVPSPPDATPQFVRDIAPETHIAVTSEWVRSMRERALGQVAPVDEFRMPFIIDPRVGVDDVTTKATQDYARYITAAISRFSDIVVLNVPTSEIAAAKSGSYWLTFSALRRDAMIEGVIQLSHRPSGEGIWSTSLALPTAEATDEARIADLARRAATRLGQLFGLLHADLRKRDVKPALRCVIAAYDYFNNASVATHRRTLDCLTAALQQNPQASILWAHLSMLLLDEHRAGFNRAGPDVLDRIYVSARTAVELAPNSPRAQQALFIAEFIRGDTDKALKTARIAFDLNPLDTDIMADLGARYIQVGRYQEGIPLLRSAIDINPAYPAWYDELLWLAARMTGDRLEMRDRAMAMARDEGTLALIMRAADAGSRNNKAEGKKLLSRLVSAAPEFAADPRAFVARRQFKTDIIDALMHDLDAAGLGEIVKR
jgi:tetratricopeptide (TPR) repeat protein